MKIAIKNPAPRGRQLERWGDFHFGKSLETALIRQGADVVQHFWPDWDRQDGEDAAIWMRGKRRCAPRPGIINAIWVLSHPSTLTKAELAAFDIVYAASARLATELCDLGIRGVELMRQCTDTRIFKADPAFPDPDRKGLLFVASSRGVRRPILEWALEAGLAPSLIGQGWPQVGVGSVVQSDYVANSELPRLYTVARYGMNDHWGDMAHYQMINNRTFDCLACGLPVISDGFPELAEVVGEGVWIVDDARSFRDAYWSIRLDYAGARAATATAWNRIGEGYTFDARARAIMDRLRASRATVQPRRRAVENSPDDAGHAVAKLVERAGGLGDDPAKVRLSLLHVFPLRATSARLSATPSLSTLAAGTGSGPWHVKLDDGQDVLGDRKFDLIFIEDGEAWHRSSQPDALACQLVGHLKPGGFIGAQDAKILQSLQADARMARVSQTPPVYRRTVERIELLMDLQATPSR